MFPEIQELLSAVEVTPAEVSEMLLRSENGDVALGILAEFLREKRRRGRKETKEKDATEDKDEEEVAEKAA